MLALPCGHTHNDWSGGMDSIYPLVRRAASIEIVRSLMMRSNITSNVVQLPARLRGLVHHHIGEISNIICFNLVALDTALLSSVRVLYFIQLHWLWLAAYYNIVPSYLILTPLAAM